MELVTAGDLEWICRRLMPYFGIPSIRIREDLKFRGVYPDIWCYPHRGVIVVTREWARQPTQERRKRVVHEILHILGHEHGPRGRFEYSTFPDRDTYSRMIYRKMVR